MTKTMVELQTRPPAGGPPGTAVGPRPVPHPPRVPAWLAYLLQKVVKPNALNRRVAALL
jgi:hypothetical protein